MGSPHELPRYLEALFSSLPELSCAFDAQGRVVAANDALLAVWGRTREEVVGREIGRIGLPEPAVDRARKGLDAVLATGRPFAREVPFRAADGHDGVFETTFSPLHVDGRIVLVVAISREITARREREQELLRLTNDMETQARFFDTTLSSINDLAYTFDLEGRWTYANKPLLELWGKTFDEIAGKTSWELGYPDELARTLKAQVKEVVATRRPLRGETFFTSGAGVVDYHEYIFSPVIAADGTVVGVCGTTRLITERKRAEEELRRRNERMQLLSGTLSQLLSATDTTTLIADLFPQVSGHLGIDAFLNFSVTGDGRALTLHSYAGIDRVAADAIRHRDLGDGICGEVARTRRAIVANGIATSLDPQVALERSLGIRACVCSPLLVGERLLGTLTFASRTRDSFDDDEVEFIKLIAQHTSIAFERMETTRALREGHERLESRVAERTQRLQETVGELESFSYSISHDLRAPLRAMQSFGSILEEEYGAEVGDVGRDYISRIVRSAERMDRLIQDILVLSKMSRADLRLEPVALGPLLRGIIESYPQFDPAKVDIDLVEPLPTVLANDAALTQCFSNLLGNATKFVAPGVRPRIRVSATSPSPGRVRVELRDNGIGIDPDAHERVFGIFQQLDKRYEGTGIGLAIVRKAVERMGGSVGLESSPGKGSTFWLDLRSSTNLTA